MGATALEEAGSLRLRAFLGLPVPEPQREKLSSFVEACSRVAPDFRWSAANAHITVRFIGSVERGVVEGIANRLENASGPPIGVALGDLGIFRRGRVVRVVWLGVSAGADQLTALAQRVELECRNAGLDPETRPFQPHLTLARARARDGSPLSELPPLPPLEPWRAEELVLYSSHLGRGGAVHEPIRSIRLTGEAVSPGS